MANKLLKGADFAQTVEFYWLVDLLDDAVFEPTNTTKRKLMGTLLSLMGYVTVNGAHVDKDTYGQTSYPFGARPEFKDELPGDYQEAINEATDNDTRGLEADSSVEAESAPVWKTVLREDV